jgi:S-adenosylmethionine decarboxylase proenzyme
MAVVESASKQRKPAGPSPYNVKVTQRFIVLSLLSCLLLSFTVGRTARILLIIKPQKQLLKLQALLMNANEMDDHPSLMKLPTPVLKEGKEVPRTLYSSKNFDTARSASINSRWVVTDVGHEQCVDQPVDGTCEPAKPAAATGETAEEGEEEQHFPSGEHLLIDIANVDSGFLNSEERLANAMLDLVNECGLTLLSYHCHSLTPMGVSCAGVLLESHVSFHTWPAEGVITLDLFTCGESQLLPVVPIAEKLFAIPSSTKPEKPQMIWAHKYRGFSDKSDEDSDALADFFAFPIGVMTDYKKEVSRFPKVFRQLDYKCWYSHIILFGIGLSEFQIITAHTDLQRVDIYDVLRPHFQSLAGYEKSLGNDGSYESLNPEFFAPDRIVFLDGILQSRRSGDAPYHEALVHPAMFAHENPKRVAIIGGGEGATLREVLKHKTVEKVVMVEIDEKMVNLSRKFLPDWSDCSNVAGSASDCFEDPRVALYCEDAFKWFIDRFANDSDTEEPFDVIIMDAL